MRKLVPTIILSAVLIAFVIKEHKEALTSETSQLAPATYRGLLPAADCAGIDYILTLNDSIAGADTLFALRMVYIEGDNNGGDITFDSRGRQQQFELDTKRGYRLMPDDGDVATYLVIENDSTLRMADSTLNCIDSPFNYKLIRTNE